MKMNKTLIIIAASIFISLTSCFDKHADNKQYLEQGRHSKLSSKFIDSCNCFTGIGSRKGDPPVLIFSFSNGKSISVCGFDVREMQEPIISEFNVFDCANGNSLAEYSATQICRIIEKKDTLVIKELKYLPVGKNWQWKLLQIGEQSITLEMNKIVASLRLPKLGKFTINENAAKDFLHSLSKRKERNNSREKEISILEVLSLDGNAKAWDILKNYETFTGRETNGALAEVWNDAVATVKWVKKN